MPGTRIELPVPFPLKTVNAWLFSGREAVLVDCGIRGTFTELVAAVRRDGVEPERLRLHLSHGHVDHAGNAAALHTMYGVPLVCPRQEAPFVETFRRDEQERNDAFAAALLHHGMPAPDVQRIRQQSDDIDAYLEDCPIAADLPDVIPFGDSDATVVRTPGHTPGSTCYIVDDQVLTGDTLLERITSNAVELKDDDRGMYHQYVETVESMRRFVGMDALPGHHAPFRISDAVIDAHLARHAARRQRILSLLDRPKTAWQLFPGLFPGLDRDSHYFMGMAEIVGHLHSLEIDGLVRRKDGDVRRFFR